MIVEFFTYVLPRLIVITLASFVVVTCAVAIAWETRHWEDVPTMEADLRR